MLNNHCMGVGIVLSLYTIPPSHCDYVTVTSPCFHDSRLWCSWLRSWLACQATEETPGLRSLHWLWGKKRHFTTHVAFPLPKLTGRQWGAGGSQGLWKGSEGEKRLFAATTASLGRVASRVSWVQVWSCLGCAFPLQVPLCFICTVQPLLDIKETWQRRGWGLQKTGREYTVKGLTLHLSHSKKYRNHSYSLSYGQNWELFISSKYC